MECQEESIMANKINVLECGPRDGWQNLKQMLTFDQKMDLIDRMFDAGVTQMEVTSFVSPKAIPQMADAADDDIACRLRRNLGSERGRRVDKFRIGPNVKTQNFMRLKCLRRRGGKRQNKCEDQ